VKGGYKPVESKKGGKLVRKQRRIGGLYPGTLEKGEPKLGEKRTRETPLVNLEKEGDDLLLGGGSEKKKKIEGGRNFSPQRQLEVGEKGVHWNNDHKNQRPKGQQRGTFPQVKKSHVTRFQECAVK